MDLDHDLDFDDVHDSSADLGWQVNKIAIWLPASEAVLADGGYMSSFVDRMMRPWLFADACPLPTLDLFPRATAAHRWAMTRLRRASDAWAVLRGREAIATDEDW